MASVQRLVAAIVSVDVAGYSHFTGLIIRRIVFAAGCTLAPLPAFADDVNELVRFESLTFPGTLFAPFAPTPQTGEPVTVLGVLRLPSGDGKVPAVVLMHGCGGIGGSEYFWARELRDRGIATFLVNSFSGRGISQICTGTYSINMASALAMLTPRCGSLRRCRG